MNVINGINLAGIVAVLGCLWKLSSDLQYDMKQLYDRCSPASRLPLRANYQDAAITMKIDESNTRAIYWQASSDGERDAQSFGLTG